MQRAEAVLDVLRERGRRGLPCDELYRQLFNKELYLIASGRIYANQGAMTPGVDGETVDGMAMAKIDTIIELVRHERYRFSPVRRVWIPKKNGKLRPLGVPSWPDKLLGEVIRLLLDAYYEPQFSGHSHGFRPRRGCHTALSEVKETWAGTTWFIEGGIADCFGSLDHDVMLSILGEKIRDNRFLRLLRNMREAGYLEDWIWNATLSGAPQGGVVSPVLSNIYLHKLDEFVETVLIPQYTRGRRRAANPAYTRVHNRLAAAVKHGDRDEARQLRTQRRALPSKDPNDPGYRRLRYVRYADDFLLGFIGPKAEAQEIKQQLGVFLRDNLRLELSPDKTLVTHARTGAATFLGYDITVRQDDTKITNGHRAINGSIALRVPAAVIRGKCAPYLKGGKPASLPELNNWDDHSIVAFYGSRYRGIVGYYLRAENVARLDRLKWVMETSMLKTLARKHDTSVTKTAARLRVKVSTPDGLRVRFQARVERGDGKPPLVAQFGDPPLKWQKTAVITDRDPGQNIYPHKELVRRLLRDRCELCQAKGHMHVHHVRSLADLDKLGPNKPAWARLMAKRRRKALVVCARCHDHIHAGHASTKLTA